MAKFMKIKLLATAVALSLIRSVSYAHQADDIIIRAGAIHF